MLVFGAISRVAIRLPKNTWDSGSVSSLLMPKCCYFYEGFDVEFMNSGRLLECSFAHNAGFRNSNNEIKGIHIQHHR